MVSDGEFTQHGVQWFINGSFYTGNTSSVLRGEQMVTTKVEDEGHGYMQREEKGASGLTWRKKLPTLAASGNKQRFTSRGAATA
jgi:hypothetical protein